MTNTLFKSKERCSFKIISREHLICLIVVVILNIPGFLISATTIYHTEHRYKLGDFAFLNFNFSFFELLLIFWSIFLLYKRSKNTHVRIVFMLILLKECLFLFSGKENVFTYNSYEMFLCMLVGISCNDIICKETDDRIDCIYFFLDMVIVFNFLWQLLFIVSGKIPIGDRVNAINMGYGAVGYLCALHILYIVLVRKITQREMLIIAIGFISILLSGSRYCLLISLMGMFVFSGYIFRRAPEKIRRWIIVALAFLSGIAVLVIVNPAVFGTSEIVERVLNLFQGGHFIQNVSNDESFLGRVLSIKIGFELIGENPAGISNSYIDIQGKTIDHGFFAFPHSNLLTYYLLWGVAFIVCIAWMIDICLKAYLNRYKGILYFMVIFIAANTIYGGVETAPKVYVYLFILMSAIKISVNRKLADSKENKRFLSGR